MLAQFHDIPAPEDGHHYGIVVVDSNRTIGQVNFYDPSGGLEGITGEAAFYTRQFPAPGAVTLLCLGLCIRRSRARQPANEQD